MLKKNVKKEIKSTSKKKQPPRRCCHGSCVATRDLVAGQVSRDIYKIGDDITYVDDPSSLWFLWSS